MRRREIERRNWPAFADAFSRCHDGWLVSVAVEEGSGARRYVTHDVPLRGVVAESDDANGSMMIFTGEVEPHAAHFVKHPVLLAVSEADDAAEVELAITGASGNRTIVELRSPMRPELVNGIA